MSTLLAFIGLASFICFFIGLIKPGLFSRLSKKPMTRKRAAGIFGATFMGALILSAAFSPPVTTSDTNSTDSENTDAIVVEKDDTVYTTEESTPEREVEKSVIAILGEQTNMKEQRVQNIEITVYDNASQAKNLSIQFAADSNLTNNLTRRGIWSDTIDLVKTLSSQIDPSIDEITVNAYLNLVDQYGNEAPGKVMTVRLTKTTWEKINWENFNPENLPNIADTYWVHPAIN